MAIVDYVFAELEGGAVVATFKRNTGNGNVTSVTVVNNSDRALVWRALEDGIERFTGEVLAGEEATYPVAGIRFEQQPDFWDTELNIWRSDGLDFGVWSLQVSMA